MQNPNITYEKQAKVTCPPPPALDANTKQKKVTFPPDLDTNKKQKKCHLSPLPEPAHLSARVVGGLQWWDNRNLGEQDNNIFQQQDQVLFGWSLELLLPCCNMAYNS